MFISPHPDAIIAIRGAVGLIFASAAIGKMRHWAEFHGVVANYRLLPQVFIRPVTYALPPAEALLGAALLCGLELPWTPAAAAALLMVFAGAMAVNLLRGRRHIDCGCFQGTLKQELRWALVVRNGAIALLLGAAIAEPSGAPDLWTAVNGLLAGVALFVIVQCMNTLWAIPMARRPTSRRPPFPIEGST
jgi:hypothetical protein